MKAICLEKGNYLALQLKIKVSVILFLNVTRPH